jgi:hypothetical protein
MSIKMRYISMKSNIGIYWTRLNVNNVPSSDVHPFHDFICSLRHMEMCNMRSYYIYKYKEKWTWDYKMQNEKEGWQAVSHV